MIKSLHIKLVIVLVLLIISVMTTTGTFLINSVMSYQIQEFRNQMAEVFTTEFLDTMIRNSENTNAAQKLKEMVEAYSASLGIDANRNFYILSKNGEYICGSNDILGRDLEKTPNVISALNGKIGDNTDFIGAYMDLAVPIFGEDSDGYIVYIKDNRQKIRDLSWMLFVNTSQSMLFGLIVSVFLSYFLSKTITVPIEDITKGAVMLAEGKFSDTLPVYSDDEIGTLTKTFNSMALQLKKSIADAEGERDKLNTLFLHMADGVVAFMGDGKLLHINPAARKMLKIETGDNLHFKDVFPDIESSSIPEIGQPGFIECNYSRGTMQFKIFFATFKTSENENGLLSVIHDITEQSRLETNRREFVANVSHELRTPLTNIKSYTETLLTDDGSIPNDMAKNFLGVIMSEADRMTHIVSDLLILSKFDYGKMVLTMQTFPLYDLLKKICDAIMLTAQKSGCNLLLLADKNLPMITADKERIEQVIVNILSNAIKYTPEGGRITVSSDYNKEGFVSVSVEDTGTGIPAEDLPKLFDRFYRVDKARSRAQGGTGLGLSIAKEIIELHKGTINVSSELGKGSTFTIVLPLNCE